MEDQTFRINRRQTLNEILSTVSLDRASRYPLTGSLGGRPNVGVDVGGEVEDGSDGDEEEGYLQRPQYSFKAPQLSCDHHHITSL